MIKIIVSNNSLETIVEIEVYYDILRSDVCLNAYYPLLRAMSTDIRHFRYWEKESNDQIANRLFSFICDIAREDENRHIKGKTELVLLMKSINYHKIFQK